jgi:hypothetical protein
MLELSQLIMFTVFVYLFICSLFNDLFSENKYSLYSVEWKGDKWMMNLKGLARNRPWPVFFWYYPSFRLEGLRKPTKTLVGIADLRPEIWTHGLPYAKQEWTNAYCKSQNFNISYSCFKFHWLGPFILFSIKVSTASFVFETVMMVFQ